MTRPRPCFALLLLIGCSLTAEGCGGPAAGEGEGEGEGEGNEGEGDDGGLAAHVDAYCAALADGCPNDDECTHWRDFSAALLDAGDVCADDVALADAFLACALADDPCLLWAGHADGGACEDEAVALDDRWPEGTDTAASACVLAFDDAVPRAGGALCVQASVSSGLDVELAFPGTCVDGDPVSCGSTDGFFIGTQFAAACATGQECAVVGGFAYCSAGLDEACGHGVDVEALCDEGSCLRHADQGVDTDPGFVFEGVCADESAGCDGTVLTGPVVTFVGEDRLESLDCAEWAGTCDAATPACVVPIGSYCCDTDTFCFPPFTPGEFDCEAGAHCDDTSHCVAN